MSNFIKLRENIKIDAIYSKYLISKFSISPIMTSTNDINKFYFNFKQLKIIITLMMINKLPIIKIKTLLIEEKHRNKMHYQFGWLQRTEIL